MYLYISEGDTWQFKRSPKMMIKKAGRNKWYSKNACCSSETGIQKVKSTPGLTRPSARICGKKTSYLGYIKHSQLLCSQLRIFIWTHWRFLTVCNSICPNLSFFGQEAYGLKLVSYRSFSTLWWLHVYSVRLWVIKSVNPQYNTLVHWADGTNDSWTKYLMFQVLFYFS